MGSTKQSCPRAEPADSSDWGAIWRSPASGSRKCWFGDLERTTRGRRLASWCPRTALARSIHHRFNPRRGSISGSLPRRLVPLRLLGRSRPGGRRVGGPRYLRRVLRSSAGGGGYLALQDVRQAQARSVSQLASEIRPITAESIASGRVVYRQYCAECHGVGGLGDGPRAATLNPRPSNLLVHVPLHSDADLEYWVANGFPGSAMPAYRDTLTAQERRDVLDYLHSAADDAADRATAAPIAPSPTPLAVPSELSSSLPSVPAAAPDVAKPIPSPSPIPTAVGNGLTQQRSVGDLRVAIQIQPAVFQPATLEVRLANSQGRPPTDVRRVDLQVAMEGMDHGARGISAGQVAPGVYRAQGMLLAMEGPWWLGIRIERAAGQVDSGVFGFRVPPDQPNGAVSVMYDRPPGPFDVVDVAVYPGEVSPNEVAVASQHPIPAGGDVRRPSGVRVSGSRRRVEPAGRRRAGRASRAYVYPPANRKASPAVRSGWSPGHRGIGPRGCCSGRPVLYLFVPRGVAQSGSAPVWGAGGRAFESHRPDQRSPAHLRTRNSSQMCRALLFGPTRPDHA